MEVAVKIILSRLGAKADKRGAKLTKRAIAVPEASLEGLKEIGNLASWTVSTAKPGNGVEQLRDEDTSLFWQ